MAFGAVSWRLMAWGAGALRLERTKRGTPVNFKVRNSGRRGGIGKGAAEEGRWEGGRSNSLGDWMLSGGAG